MTTSSPIPAILITGAAGGLGRAIVEASLKLPHIPKIIATDIQAFETTGVPTNPRISHYTLDVTSESSLYLLRKTLENDNIRVKYLVNNAGINSFFPVTEASEALLDELIKVNVYGPVLTTSAFLSHLAETRGRVVQISSDSVRLPLPLHPYPSSKIAQEAFGVSMRRELKLLGVDLVMIRPGAISTRFLDDMQSIRNPIANSRYQTWFERFARQAVENIGKRSQPAEVARLVSRALMAKKPRLYYSCNKNAKITFFKWFPEHIQDSLFRRFLERT